MVATAFLVFYRFKTMNKEEAEKAKGEWENLRNGLTSGIELVGEYIHDAWGTEYNGQEKRNKKKWKRKRKRKRKICLFYRKP